MKTNNKKSKKIFLCTVISGGVLLSLLGSYAYFVGNLGSNKQEEVNTQAGNLALTFSDGNNVITEALEFGGSVEKTFSIQNTGSLNAIARIMWDDLVNTYLDGSLTYTISSSDTETGKYTSIVENQNVPTSKTSIKELLAGNLTIPTGSTKYYKLTITLNYLDDVDQTADLKASLSTHFSIEESDGKDYTPVIQLISFALANKKTVPENKKINKENPNFNQVATTDEGIFAMEDDYGTSYYYRGAVKDNYVKFAGFYWRIIRVNGNGSVRLIYDGTKAYPNGEMDNTDRIGPTHYNNSNTDVKYLGYMYGPNGSTSSTNVQQAQSNLESSNIKIELEKWYKNNIYDNGFDSYISDTLFCNDRGIYLGNGYGQKSVRFNSDNRLSSNKNPSLFCEQQNDRFTVNDTEIGNGDLVYPIALISADEVMLAGAGTGEAKANNTFYLAKKYSYFTMTPLANSSVGTNLNIWINSSYLEGTIVGYSKRYVMPVISLTPEYFTTLIGDGTISNPFRAPNDEP